MPLTLIDGWLTDDPDEFRFYREDVNQWTYRQQLEVDVRSWKPWAFWLTGATPIGLGLFGHSGQGRSGEGFLLVTIGVLILVTYVLMMVAVVQGLRRVKLIEARVSFDRPHPLVSGLLAGEFHHPESKVKGLATLPEWAVRQLQPPNGSLGVLIAWNSEAEYCSVVGVRPPPEPSAQNPEQSRW